MPFKSAIPHQILDNPYYALILNSAGQRAPTSGNNPEGVGNSRMGGQSQDNATAETSQNISSQIPHVTFDVLNSNKPAEISYEHLSYVTRHFVNSSREPF